MAEFTKMDFLNHKKVMIDDIFVFNWIESYQKAVDQF